MAETGKCNPWARLFIAEEGSDRNGAAAFGIIIILSLWGGLDLEG